MPLWAAGKKNAGCCRSCYYGFVGDLTFALALRGHEPEWLKAFDALCELLGDDLGRRVKPLAAHAPSALAEAIGSGRANFGWVSPTLLMMAPSLATVVPLLSSVREGVAAFHSVVFTAPSSPFTTAADLEGVRAAWVAPTSASGYLVARLALARLGVDVDRAIASEVFLDSHGAVAEAVLSGAADIGGTYAHFDRGDARRALLRTGFDEHGQARVLAVGGPIPADMIVAAADTDICARIAFAGALSHLAQDPVGSAPLRRVIGADDFQPVSNEMLAELRALMAASVAAP